MNRNSYMLPKTVFAMRRRAAMKEAGRLDAMLVNHVEDVGYFTGFSGDDSLAIFGKGRDRGRAWAVLLTDGRYDEQASKECPGIEIFVRKGAMPQAVADCLKGRKVRRLGVQADYVTLHFRDAIQKAIPRIKLIPVDDFAGELRQVKDAAELNAIRKAIRIAQEAFLSLLAQGRKAFVGRTERQVAAELDYRMRLAGADGPSFDSIIAVGPHG